MRARATMQGNAIVVYAIATLRINPSLRCAFHDKSKAGILKTIVLISTPECVCGSVQLHAKPTCQISSASAHVIPVYPVSACA